MCDARDRPYRPDLPSGSEFHRRRFRQNRKCLSAPALQSNAGDELWADIGLSHRPTRELDSTGRSGGVKSFVARSSKPPTRRNCTKPMISSSVKAAGLRRKASELFRSAFPRRNLPGDDGWHIDVSFGDDNPDFMEWRANVKSRGRALLMLFLLSDVGPDDAPTRITERLARRHCAGVASLWRRGRDAQANLCRWLRFDRGLRE